MIIITNSEHANSTHFTTQHFDSTALGFVEKEDRENTQTGTMQLSSKNTIEGCPEDAINRKNAGKQYIEKWELVGLQLMKLDIFFGICHNTIKGNIMNEKEETKARNVTPQQRDEMLKNIPQSE